jgi:hypothetical protein
LEYDVATHVWLRKPKQERADRLLVLFDHACLQGIDPHNAIVYAGMVIEQDAQYSGKYETGRKRNKKSIIDPLETAPASVYARIAALVGLSSDAPWQIVRDKLTDDNKTRKAQRILDASRPMTAEDALALTYGDVIYHARLRNSDGSAVRARCKGKVKTWKRRPGEFQVPMKHGLRDCFYLTPNGAQPVADWRLEDPTEIN